MNESEYIPIAALNQYAYCPHRCWRMFCAGEFTENEYTIEGTSLHDRVHSLSQEKQGEDWQIRAIWLKSRQYGLIGKSDLIEASNGEIFPVEYKRGRKGEWDNDELQVGAQALCLEEMTGKTVKIGYIYYAHSHQRQEVEISKALRDRVSTNSSNLKPTASASISSALAVRVKSNALAVKCPGMTRFSLQNARTGRCGFSVLGATGVKASRGKGLACL